MVRVSDHDLRLGVALVHVLLQPVQPLENGLGRRAPAERAALVVLPALLGAFNANRLAAALVETLRSGSEREHVQADGDVPRQSRVPSSGALALTTAVVVGRAADKRAAALEPSADKTSSTMAGSSLGFFFGINSSRSRSWKSAAICLHCALCPRSDQSTSWHFLEQ
eukprot:CAMPEP_0206831470 /NCGR_PEP_ID=MMETSP0975-20121206/17400_1 /ASSEMBLY_ACC=CAM_ASM_000399 /TAXON_ID=483370 /ORGANISM="non described non described, Strain CCMP2097" /LENGTH=166 /DNA_ID=CAMNT_0054373845 /DNA_START=696 /DNA_END=1197 /DNA_ORIENTATION=-